MLLVTHYTSEKLAKQLSEQHRVSLQLETEGGDAYLVCTDNGIGMTKAIIRDRVLVTGSSPRHDVRTLDRRCREAGFDLGRSGQFVLEYNLLHDRDKCGDRNASRSGGRRLGLHKMAFRDWRRGEFRGSSESRRKSCGNASTSQTQRRNLSRPKSLVRKASNVP